MQFKIIKHDETTGTIDVELENGFIVNVGLDSLFIEDNPTEQELLTALSTVLPDPAYFERHIPKAAVLTSMLNKEYTTTDVQGCAEPCTWDTIRGHRTNLLRGCDWTQIEDNTLTKGQRKDWASYRQKLRDIPQAYTEPQAVAWPEQPETGELQI
ncbi:tail fiber assembly protein [Zooshikella sp. RANM57]|uniref:tail fiber assembly protein n=1 Tax=Zooshikella sp. RANM57 TaxID=3425863 RepID=UPI003D6F4B4B